MDAAKNNRWNRRRIWTVPAAFLGVLAFSVLGADRPKIREQVQFSAPGEPVEAPVNPRKNEGAAPAFEFLGGGNSISGVVAPLVSPSPSSMPRLNRNPRLMEIVDQRKHWAYVRPQDTQHDPSANEILGVNDSDKLDNRPKSTLEHYFEDRGEKPSEKRVGKNREAWKSRDSDGENQGFRPAFGLGARGETNGSTRFESPWDSTRPVTAGFGFGGGGLFATAPGPGSWNRAPGASAPDGTPGGWGARERDDEFRKLLAVPGSVNPLVPAFDPINLRVDATRQPLNPVIGQTPGGLPAAGAGGGVFGDLGTPAGSLNRSSLLNDPASRLLGPSSLGPAVAAPGPTRLPMADPKPTILEFPKRPF